MCIGTLRGGTSSQKFARSLDALQSSDTLWLFWVYRTTLTRVLSFFRTPALILSLSSSSSSSSSSSELGLGYQCAVAEWVFSLVEWGAAFRLVSSRCFSSFTFAHLLSLLLWVDFGYYYCSALLRSLLLGWRFWPRTDLARDFLVPQQSAETPGAQSSICAWIRNTSFIGSIVICSIRDANLFSRSCRITPGSFKYFSLQL
jgi:hypothetical protein